MANELQSLSILFQNKLFRIPDYQRGYAWRNEQLIDFWDDLMNLNEDRYHYTGLLSLKAISPKKAKVLGDDAWLVTDLGFTAFHIVDGQQRLTTFSILVNELVSFVKKLPQNIDKPQNEILVCYQSIQDICKKYILMKRPPQNLISSYLFGYETDNPSADYLKHKIYEEPNGGTIDETYYTKNLKRAKAFFAENLLKLFNEEGFSAIESLYKKLTLRLMFNIHEIEDDYDVFVAFETMNNRGKKLTNLELLKNRLIYLTTLFNDYQFDVLDKDHLRKSINDAWKEVYFQLGRNQNKPLDDDDFLSAHWITYFKYTRKKGDDYIKFLLNKFSAKNIFEKQSIINNEEIEDVITDNNSDEDLDNISTESEDLDSTKLKPVEIFEYVNNLKQMAEYWYYSFYPYDSTTLSNDEKVWIEKLNNIGIGYFRPLVAIALCNSNKSTVEERVYLFKAIERFIFVNFRMGSFQSSYKSSDYYNKTRELAKGSKSISEITTDLIDTTNKDKTTAITNFFTRTKQRFSNGNGFYAWKDLRYFLFEYEYDKSVKYNIQKVDWSMFAKVERDKITIEHILPQTPTKLYWRNQFRQYTSEEIKILSSTLGNLLPLANSINASLQNDGFDEKKTTSTNGRRGYENGSHSEIEVSKNEDWTAKNILERGLYLLDFMEKRWDVSIGDTKQKIELLAIEFVNDDRANIPEIIEPLENTTTTQTKNKINENQTNKHRSEGDLLRRDFWESFITYCENIGRTHDVARRKASYSESYDVKFGAKCYHVFFQIIGKQYLKIGLYVYNPEHFSRLVSKKDEIEKLYGDKLDWNASSDERTERRILHSIDANVHDKAQYKNHFAWLVNQYDKLFSTLKILDGESFYSNI